MSAKPSSHLPTVSITSQIRLVREQKVMLDVDLAALYGVTTGNLVQAVKRNASRFPADFMFQLDPGEWSTLRSQSVISNSGRGGRRYPPYAFTELGVAMLSSVLGGMQAIAVNIEIMRAFVRLREVLASNNELALRLNELENKTALLPLQHDTFADDTRVQLKQIFDVIRALVAPAEPVKKRAIGFVTPTEGSATPKASM
ncbi:ORF6N domain-containing protein [Massilia sp. CCM 8733]|uniref:ORF6N domain-containing protein n=1 Tax=Massilia mucilaginosa TaxID=2609282 RepID=A0ABX0P4J7_9BURK|nr:ORF6N domain-containing protein [Massilia mucilaginosa]NHZ93357.1 ORF6N domain-containing protein [Massilia mucilaginosa]